jgi:hypothetical protein
MRTQILFIEYMYLHKYLHKCYRFHSYVTCLTYSFFIFWLFESACKNMQA